MIGTIVTVGMILVLALTALWVGKSRATSVVAAVTIWASCWLFAGLGVVLNCLDTSMTSVEACGQAGDLAGPVFAVVTLTTVCGLLFRLARPRIRAGQWVLTLGAGVLAVFLASLAAIA